MNQRASYSNKVVAKAFGGIVAKKAKFTGDLPAAPAYKDIPAKSLKFNTFFHPYANDFISKLNEGGIDRLLDADTTIDINNSIPDIVDPIFESYQPGGQELIDPQHPRLNLDFGEFGSANANDISQGPYAIYNQELFFHVPLYIATRLSKNGKYAEAMKWFHYIFDPTTNLPVDAGNPEARYWNVLPFKNKQEETVQSFLDGLKPNTGNRKINAKIQDWLDNPFKPHVVARSRPISYMKNVIFKYVDNLIAWADDLFRRDTIESINEATQLYIIASHILGDKPQLVPERGKTKAKTFHELKGLLDDFSNALVSIENYLPFSSDVEVPDKEYPGNLLGAGQNLYFCIPNNEKMLKYWDTVADRLFKIRHCMNIEGVERKLDLFEPEIDPALLIAATAKGLSISSILSDLRSPAPFYRFNYLAQKAIEFCAEVKSLGNTFLSAIEKKDAEELSRKRAQHESQLLDLMTAIKERQVLEAKANKSGLEKNRETAKKRLKHYTDLLGLDGTTIPDMAQLPLTLTEDSTFVDTSIPEISIDVDVSLVEGGEKGVKLIPKEKEELDKNSESQERQLAAGILESIAGFIHLIPTFASDVKPVGIGAGFAFGGAMIGRAISASARAIQVDAAVKSYEASKASKMASFIRRDQEWVLQANMAAREIIQIDKQIVSADIRIQIAGKELENHKQQIINAQEVEQFLKDKFSGMELYQWMKEQLYAVYKQSYQLAYDMAKKAEKAYRFELGLSDSNFIQYGYWDDMYKGLGSGEKLHLALKQMEKSYLEENRREFELTKHISIVSLNPFRLLELKQTGSCEIELPEELFDLDYPGHYFRRIKSVSITVPCIIGPYTMVNCTLRLLKNSVRVNIQKGNSDNYEHNHDDGIPVDDDRFIENNIPFKAIATSSAQNDSGVFELNFRDDRYLPFEGAGAISSWRLELTDPKLSQFDYNSISDIILHIKYTSREDSGNFRKDAIKHLDEYMQKAIENAPEPFMRLFSLKHEFPEAFNQLINKADKIQKTEIEISKIHFNRVFANRILNVVETNIFIKPKEGKAVTDPAGFKFDNTAANAWIAVFDGSLKKTTIPSAEFNPLKKVTIEAGTQGGNDGLKKNEVEDLLILFSFSVKA